MLHLSLYRTDRYLSASNHIIMSLFIPMKLTLFKPLLIGVLSITPLFATAAESSPEADYLLAQRYAEQRQLEPMYQLVAKSALNGYAPAQYTYYRMYFAGAGVERDYQQAYIWLSKAANNDNATAQLVMGGYLDPRGDGKEDTRSEYELEKRRLFIEENGLQKDAKLAQMWFARSAQSGNENALKYLTE